MRLLEVLLMLLMRAFSDVLMQFKYDTFVYIIMKAIETLFMSRID